MRYLVTILNNQLFPLHFHLPIVCLPSSLHILSANIRRLKNVLLYSQRQEDWICCISVPFLVSLLAELSLTWDFQPCPIGQLISWPNPEPEEWPARSEVAQIFTQTTSITTKMLTLTIVDQLHLFLHQLTILPCLGPRCWVTRTWKRRGGFDAGGALNFPTKLSRNFLSFFLFAILPSFSITSLALASFSLISASITHY